MNFCVPIQTYMLHTTIQILIHMVKGYNFNGLKMAGISGDVFKICKVNIIRRRFVFQIQHVRHLNEIQG